MRRWPLFNWKPYWGFNPLAKIVHFHGPKPADYLARLVAPNAPDRIRLFDGLLERCGGPYAFVRNAAAAVLSEGELGGVGCFRLVRLYLEWRRALAADPLPNAAIPERVRASLSRTDALLHNISLLEEATAVASAALSSADISRSAALDPAGSTAMQGRLLSAPQTLCLVSVDGRCVAFPSISNLRFLDRAKGGPPEPTRGECAARQGAWQQDCGPKATVRVRLESTSAVLLGHGGGPQHRLA